MLSINFTSILYCCSLFIALNLLSMNMTNAAESNLLSIEVPYVELHSGPGIGYPVLYVVEKGEAVTVLRKRTSWFKVQDKRGNEGWFHQDALLQVSQAGEKVSVVEANIDDYQQRQFETSVMYGDFDGSNYYSLGFAYLFDEAISTELAYGKALGAISDSDMIDLMLTVQPFSQWLVSPYLSIGGGGVSIQPHSVLADAKKRQHALMAGALGVKYYLARNFIMRAEVKQSVVLTDRNDNEEIQTWQLGFSVFF